MSDTEIIDDLPLEADEAEPRNPVEEALFGLIDEAMDTSARSLYAQGKKVGVSDIGGCREYVRRLIADEDFTDPRKNFMAAFMGTAFGREFEDAYQRRHPHALIQQAVEVPLDLQGFQFVLPGHLDIVDPKLNTIIDGKGLALDTPIPTPTGWTVMGALRVGDAVLDMAGNAVTVDVVSTVKNIGCYEVEFANGHVIVCDEEHLWVAQRGFRATPGVVPVADLRVGDCVPVAGALDLPDAELPLNPWMLGYWLGNGHHADAMVSTHGDDAREVQLIAQSLGYRGLVRHDKRGSNTATVSLAGQLLRDGSGRVTGSTGFYGGVRDLGLDRRKYVPDTYLRSSREQRLALLRGLMDSDGTWNKTRRRASFTSTTRDLADAVAELARSLGQRVQTWARESSGYGKAVTAFYVEWTPTVNPFLLRRKSERVTLASDSGMTDHRVHRVVRIERVASVPTQCISVNSPTETYLAGEAMIPTHNTKNGLAVVRKSGGDMQHKFQVTLYGYACVQAGLLEPEPTLALAYYDRSGVEQAPHIVSWEWDQSIFDAAIEWLNDVVYALTQGEEASKDKPRDWCYSFCPFATACRGGDTDVEGLIEDETIVTAIDLYKDALARETAAKRDKDTAKKELVGVGGRTKDWVLRWVHIGESEIKAGTRRAYDKIDIRPNRG